MAAPRLAHNVFFKLKDASPAKVQALVDACMKYVNVQPAIVFFATGAICAELDRPVNDRDWHVGMHLLFIDKAAHDAYQDDATHIKFVDEMKPNWAGERV